MNQSTDWKRRERGSTMVEFVMSSLFWAPLLMGTSVIGLNLIRAIQVHQIDRDLGRMYAYGTDFYQTSTQGMITRLALGLNFNASGGGNGVVIFSNVMYVGDTQCTAAGKLADSARCPNWRKVVVTRRFIVGNNNLCTSNYSSLPRDPASSSIIGTGGNISANDYLTQSAVVVNNLPVTTVNQLSQQPGGPAYITETFFRSPDIDWAGFMSGTGVYANAVF
jgi:hypothetical protein